MTTESTSKSDFSRYFELKQRAHLINISENRDMDHFESLSGINIYRSIDSVELHIPYATDQSCTGVIAHAVKYKLTTESMGNGIQILADLIMVTGGNIFHLKLHGIPELFQRRKTARINTLIPTFQISRDIPLNTYRNEFKSINESLKEKQLPATVTMKKNQVNLSSGGIRISINPTDSLFPLSLFFFDIKDSQPPICAVAELIWNTFESDKRICGYRFVQIRKADQLRISKYVESLQKELGIEVPPQKINWELVDRMSNEPPEDSA